MNFRRVIQRCHTRLRPPEASTVEKCLAPRRFLTLLTPYRSLQRGSGKPGQEQGHLQAEQACKVYTGTQCIMRTCHDTHTHTHTHTSMVTNISIQYTSVSHQPGRGPVPGPGINYTGQRQILLELKTNLNLILYLSKCHTVHISVLIFFIIMP